MIRRALPTVALALLLAACGGADDGDSDSARLRAADEALEQRPRDPRALAAVIQAAYDGAQNDVDEVTGAYRPGARPFLDRAAAVWPRYLAVTRERPDRRIAASMSVLLADGLKRPRDAAQAQRYAIAENPSGPAYLRLAYLYVRAGDRRRAELSGRKAVELSEPHERDRVRSTIRELIPDTG